MAAVVSFSAVAQAPALVWQKSLGGSTTDEAYSISQTTDGGYIVAGPSQSIDGQVTGHHGTPSNFDYWIAKINDTGAIQWENSFGGTADDILFSVQQTKDGGYILAGAAESIDGDLSTCDIWEYDYWLIKLTSTGALSWKSCYGGHGGGAFNEAFAVQQTPDSGFVVAGYTNSTDSGEVTGYHGGNDYWILKTSPTGGFQWAKCLGGSASDICKGVHTTPGGGYIVCGSSSSGDGQVTGHKGIVGIPDYWVVKLDDTGGLSWEKSYGGSGTDQATSVIPTLDGGYIVVGNSNSTDSQVTGNHGGYDIWAVKIDDTGAIQWQRSLGGAGDEWATQVQQTLDSGYVISGYSDSASGQVTGTHGGNDYWIVKLSKKGYLQWQKALGGSGTDEAYSLQQTPDSGYIVAGGSNSTNGDVTGNHGAYDFWVTKLSACQVVNPPVITQTGVVMSTTIPYTTYKWEKNGVAIPGATNATYTVTSNGSYTVFVTDSNMCTSTSPLPKVEVGVRNLAPDQHIVVLPNPATSTIYIQALSPLRIGLYNMLGQMVREVDNSASVSVAGLPPGLYLLRLWDENGQLVYQDKIRKQ